MNSLREAIDEKRNIKANSLNAYLISIKKVHNAIEDGEYKNLDFLKKIDKVKEFLSKLKKDLRNKGAE